MKFEEKLKKKSKKEIWDEYCGFLELSMDEYMEIQQKLLKEQLEIFSNCDLGQRFLKGKMPKTVEEFRQMIPITTYYDYYDILLNKQNEKLPSVPEVWLKTTWESGERTEKWAPYSKKMLDTFRKNIIAAMMLSTSMKKGDFHVKPDFKVLYALAPLPYITGLFPDLIDTDIQVRFFPPLEEARKMSFGQQSKVGFKMGISKGLDMFFGMSSIIHRISMNFNLASGGSGGIKSLCSISPVMLFRFMKAKYVCKKENRPMKPKDLFKLKGFVCAGADTVLFQKDLEDAWGTRPLEVNGGTEPTCLGTETWSKDGLVLFPDACFYEFIPEDEMWKSLDDKSYQPKTLLMNELTAGKKYELVVTVFHGGSFVRYRPGDVYCCIRLSNPKDGIQIPQFQYVDRVPTVIDLAGFTRMTKQSVSSVLEMSGIDVQDWFAVKKYDGSSRPYMKMYIELSEKASQSVLSNEELLTAHLSLYFNHYDNDYSDLKKMLGIEPLSVEVVPVGIFDKFKKEHGYAIRKLNPPSVDEMDFLRLKKVVTAAIALV